MAKKNRILMTILMATMFIIGLFLPSMDFSFNMQLVGWQCFGFSFGELLIQEDFASYLAKGIIALAPVFGIVLIGWLYREKVNTIPLILLSLITLYGASSWLFAFPKVEGNVLLFGYYYWLVFNFIVIVLNLYRNTKAKTADND